MYDGIKCTIQQSWRSLFYRTFDERVGPKVYYAPFYFVLKLYPDEWTVISIQNISSTLILSVSYITYKRDGCSFIKQSWPLILIQFFMTFCILLFCAISCWLRRFVRYSFVKLMLDILYTWTLTFTLKYV